MCICWGRHSSAVLLRMVAKLRTCQGCNTARLCKTTAPGNLKFQNFKSFQDTAQAKLPNYRPGKASLLNCRHCRPWLQNRLGQLQHCKTFQASLLNCRALARLQNCQPARAPTLQGCKTTALANLANLPKFQHCRLPTCCKVCQTTNKAAKSTARLQHCRHTQLQGFSSLPSSLLNCRARLQTTTSC